MEDKPKKHRASKKKATSPPEDVWDAEDSDRDVAHPPTHHHDAQSEDGAFAEPPKEADAAPETKTTKRHKKKRSSTAAPPSPQMEEATVTPREMSLNATAMAAVTDAAAPLPAPPSKGRPSRMAALASLRSHKGASTGSAGLPVAPPADDEDSDGKREDDRLHGEQRLEGHTTSGSGGNDSNEREAPQEGAAAARRHDGSDSADDDSQVWSGDSGDDRQTKGHHRRHDDGSKRHPTTTAGCLDDDLGEVPAKPRPPAYAAMADHGGRQEPESLPRMLRLQRAYESNMHMLYSFCAMHTLEWPSLTVDWIPDRRFADPERDYTLNYLVVGTQAARGAPNCVRVMEVAVANPSAAGAMYGLYGDEDIDQGDTEMEEMYATSVDPGKLYLNVQGHLACEQVVQVDAPVLRVRALPVETNIIAVKTASGFIGVYNLVQELQVDAHGQTVPEALLRGHKTGGFGLSWNTVKLGYIASGSDDGYVNYWDIKHRISVDYIEDSHAPDLVGPEVQPLHRLSGHHDIVTDVSWHESHGHLLASASMDGDVRVWDTRFNSVCATLAGAHVGGATCAQFHPVGAFQIATGGMDNEVHLWDIRRPKDPVVALTYHGRAVQSLQWSPFDERMLASSGDDGRVVLWDLGKTALPLTYSEDGMAPPEVAFVHLGHMGRVTDHAWGRSKEDPLLMASVDTVNGLQIYRPKEAVVKDYVPALAR